MYAPQELLWEKLCVMSQLCEAVRICTATQDRRGHLKASKYSSQISEFDSSFSQSSVCRHRDYLCLYLAAWIDILLNESVLCIHGSRLLKASDCCQMFILQTSQKNMFSNGYSVTAIFLQSFIAHPIIFFSNFCDQNWTF